MEEPHSIVPPQIANTLEMTNVPMTNDGERSGSDVHLSFVFRHSDISHLVIPATFFS